MSTPLRILRDILLLSVIALLILTLAQPRLGFTSIKAAQLGRDVIIAVDTSRSMLATDLAPNRLARTKLFAQDLVNLLQGDRLGLIAFAGTAFLQAPLTTDYGAVLNSLKELDTHTIPRGGTNMTSAIQIAEEAFGHAEGATRALILVSDGEDLELDAVFEAKRAAAQGIRIFTVGVGSATGSLLPITTDEGQQDFVRDTNGKPVISRLDETRLKEIAEASGGFYSTLSPSTAQEIFHKGIQPLTERQGQAVTSSCPIERFEWPLIPAILLLATWWLLGDRRRRMQNRGSSRSLFFAFFLGATISVQAQSGLKSYEKGDYQNAFKNFESYTRQRPSLAEAFFDAGAAAYQLGAYEKALDFFGKSVLGKNVPLRTKAQYNMGNTLVRKGEAASVIDQKKALWKAAIQQYDQVLKQEPQNTLASDNKKIVEKMLEELDRKKNEQNPKNQQDQKNPQEQQEEKQNPQAQQNQQQDQKKQQNPQNEQKQQQENQKQDQQNQQQHDQKNEQAQKSQQDQQNPRNQPQQPQPSQQQPSSPPNQQPQQQQEEQQRNQQNQQNQHQSSTPSPTPKKKGPIGEMGKQQQAQQGGSEPASTGAGGKTLTREQANTLIDSMEGEEQRLKPAGQSTTPPDIYKDW